MARSSAAIYIVRGKIPNAPGNSHIWAFDHDPGREHPMAAAPVEADGTFEITFTQRAAGSRSEGHPELRMKIQLPDGSLHNLDADRNLSKAGKHDLGTIAFDAPSPDIETNPGSALSDETAGGPSATAGTMEEPTDTGVSIKRGRPHGSTARQPTAPRSPFYHGPFGRMFRKLPPWIPPGETDAEKEESIRSLSDTAFEPSDDVEGDNDGIPAAYTYFGQFVDHDITFDPASSLERQNDPNMLVNFRTPSFDLDNLYGEGPADEPFMYDRNRPGRS